MSTRKSNIELLRIIAMLLIILGHSSSHGVFHFGEPGSLAVWQTGSIINRGFSSLLLPGGAVGVGIFFMITGYFQVNKEKYSLTRVLSQVFFYSLLISVIYIIVSITGGSMAGISPIDFFYNHLMKSLFNPLSGGAWWYVSVYLIIMLTSPLINSFLKALTKKGYISFLILFLILWYGISYLTNGSYIQLERGLFFYSLGAFLRLYGMDILRKFSGIKALLVFAAFWISGGIAYYFYGSLLVNTYLTGNALKIVTDLLDLYVFVCVTPVCAFSIFSFFKGLHLGSIGVINLFASTTFGIYLFHDANIIRPFLWNSLVKMDSKLYLSGLYPLTAIAVSLLIFLCCFAIDYVRIRLFEKIISHMIDNIKKKAEALFFESK